MTQNLESPQAVAQRLITLRNAIDLSRNDIETKHGIKSASLRSWEMGHRTLKQRTAETLVSVFNKHGIPCTVDWILKGQGRNPLEAKSSIAGEDESYILKEIYRFESSYENACVIQVEDHYMASWIRKGDFVGGVFVSPEDPTRFVGQVCIVKTREFGTQIRRVEATEKEGLYNLISFSDKGNLLKVEIEAVAIVLFLRRRLETIE